MSKPQRSTATRRRVPDGTPTLCGDGCGRQVIWLTSNYGSRVALDVEPVPDADKRARYWINWDAPTPLAVSLRKLSFTPDAPGERKYSTHFDTCPVKTRPVAEL